MKKLFSWTALKAKIKGWGAWLPHRRPPCPPVPSDETANDISGQTSTDIFFGDEPPQEVPAPADDLGESTELLDRTAIMAVDEVDPSDALEAEIDQAMAEEEGVDLGEMPPVPGPQVSGDFSVGHETSSADVTAPFAMPALPWKQRLILKGRQYLDTLMVYTQKLGAWVQKRFPQQENGGPSITSWRDLGHFLQEKIFSPDSRPQVQQVFVVLLLVITAWTSGKILAQLLSVKPKLGGSTNVAPAARIAFEEGVIRIGEANLFQLGNQTTVVKAPRKVNTLLCETADHQSSLGISLVNTVTLQDTAKSVASLKVGNELMNVREGSKVNEEAVIGRIERLRVYLRNLSNGECEYLQNDQQAALDRQRINVLPVGKGQELLNRPQNANIRNEGNRFEIKKQYRDQILSNMGSVLSQARAVQIRNPDGTYYFKMTEIVPGSIYGQLNIQDGDIITTINGKKISNLNEVISLLGRIKDIRQFQLGVQRNGQEQTFEYNFN
jgi:type II secretion system protein C